jgi:uncharacterized membrane protein
VVQLIVTVPDPLVSAHFIPADTVVVTFTVRLFRFSAKISRFLKAIVTAVRRSVSGSTAAALISSLFRYRPLITHRIESGQPISFDTAVDDVLLFCNADIRV